VNPAGDGVLGPPLRLQARELQQVVISRALLGICQDFVGTNDLPEFQRSIRIARSDVGVGAFDG